ncbi:hypothetical protein NZK27_11905 [Synechococcus sp. FGCU-3]|nr:hypothetical protein [Synechococcus sp. FGCU3]
MNYAKSPNELPQSKAIFRSPNRISITLPECTYQNLLSRSDAEGRSLSNLAAFLLETALRKMY